MNWLRRKSWSPYAAGVGIGMLSWAAFLLLKHPLGVSTGITRVAGMVGGPRAAELPYFQALQPFFNFEVMLIAGIFLGAFLSARLSGDRAETGPGWRRGLSALAGGFLLMFGARLAGGCTSGHGISGALQLAVSGWAFFAVVFATGIATAFLGFRKEASDGR